MKVQMKHRSFSCRVFNGGIRILMFTSMYSLLPGCATFTNRQNILVTMAATSVSATAIGFLTTPNDGTSSTMHGLYFGAIGATVAGVTGLYVFDEQAKSAEAERKFRVQQKQLDALKEEGGDPTPILLHETNAPIGKDIPAEYKKLVTPGRWSLYQINQWIPQGEGVLVHQDKMLKLVPPQINLNNSSEDR